ncbi:hypothetical protein NYR70_07005 [Actinobacillus equuli subsp. equuli]|uniref:DUF4870 domain-containing protein n=2 Tax=Actinobacillus equuli TaxID=718 RepID=A0A0A7MIK5_ACTEU|nr:MULTISPECIES: membrane protein [Actinobacillus]AIZ79642.1 membrane protein [Actinobacillus equuli subsp. equuli]MDE8034394.1 hypothetical protein [Actinobacillus equuli subsp. equuli]MDG4947441.1 hypothetical protein [Actinobacillus equuli subsp. haemolyticus]MDG4952876.1 hypothetical protein [Actinobacillus equuli subsp. equuli]WGE41541.1 hypothetical protein NYR64_07300 [Actinobacillus equuli subsp. haemolyticus]
MNEQFSLQPSNDSLRTVMYITYGLFGLGIIFGGLPAIAGVILAYIKRADMQGTAYYDHMCFLIRTFWGTLAGTILGIVLSLIGIGILVIWAIGIWYIFRVIYGAVKLFDNKSVTPTGWFM